MRPQPPATPPQPGPHTSTCATNPGQPSQHAGTTNYHSCNITDRLKINGTDIPPWNARREVGAIAPDLIAAHPNNPRPPREVVAVRAIRDELLRIRRRVVVAAAPYFLRWYVPTIFTFLIKCSGSAHSSIVQSSVS